VAQLGSSSGGEENGTDMRACISAARMREGSLRGIHKFLRESVFWEIHQGRAGRPDGPTNEVASCGGGGLTW
jgi:hypothetical protein